MGKSTAGSWIKRHFWVIFADALGVAWLISLLLAANGSPALKPVMLGLLLLVPVTGLIIMFGSHRQPRPDPKPVPIAVSQRTIFTTPSPQDQRR